MLNLFRLSKCLQLRFFVQWQRSRFFVAAPNFFFFATIIIQNIQLCSFPNTACFSFFSFLNVLCMHSTNVFDVLRRHMDERRHSTGREISCRCLAEHTEAALSEQKSSMSAWNLMSIGIVVNKKRYCRGTQVVNGRVSRFPGECEETALFLVLPNTSILVKPINIQAESLCATDCFFFFKTGFEGWTLLQMLGISTFPAIQTVGVLTWENPRAPPWHGTDLLRITGTSSEKGMVSFLGFACCHPSECGLSVKPGAGNGTKTRQNRSSVSSVATSSAFSHIRPFWKRPLRERLGRQLPQWCRCRVTCCGAKMGPTLLVCPCALQEQIEDELRDGGKLAAGGRLASK